MWKPTFFYCRIRIERWIVQCRLERPEEAGTKEITKLSTVLFDNSEDNAEINDWIMLALLILIFLGLLYQLLMNIMATCVCGGRRHGQVNEELELTIQDGEEDDRPRRRPRQRDP